MIKFGARVAIGDGKIASFKGQAPLVSRFFAREPDFIDKDKNLADILKLDILALGHKVQATWSPIGALEPTLKGKYI